MRPPPLVIALVAVLGLLGVAGIVAGLVIAPNVFIGLPLEFMLFVLGFAALWLLATSAVFALWHGAPWSRVVLVAVAGLVVAWAAVVSKAGIEALIVALACGVPAGLLFAPPVRRWIEREPLGRLPKASLATWGAGVPVLAWLALVFPILSLYTNADGRTLARDAGLGLVAGIAAIVVAASGYWRASAEGSRVAARVLVACVVGVALVPLLALHAEDVSVSEVDSGRVTGQEGFAFAAGAGLVAAALAIVVALWRADDPPRSLAASARMMALATGIALAGFSAWLLLTAPRLVAAAQARKHTPGFEVVILVVAALVALLKPRRANRDQRGR